MFFRRHLLADNRTAVKTAVAGLMVALFSLVLAMSLSGELHHFFHCDSHSPSHHCVATQMAAGQLLESPAVVAVPAPVWHTVPIAPIVDFIRLPARDLRLMPERAPPSSAA